MGMSAGIGSFIQQRREELGLSQLELARLVGMDRAYLSQIENSTSKWPQKYVTRLAEALQVPEVELAIAAGKIPRESVDFRNQVFDVFKSPIGQMDRYLRLIRSLKVVEREGELHITAFDVSDEEWAEFQAKLLKVLDEGAPALRSIQEVDALFFLALDFLLVSVEAAETKDPLTEGRVERDRKTYIESLTALIRFSERIEAADRVQAIDEWKRSISPEEVSVLRGLIKRSSHGEGK